MIKLLRHCLEHIITDHLICIISFPDEELFMKNKTFKLIISLLVATSMLSSCGGGTAGSVPKRSLVDPEAGAENDDSKGIKITDRDVEVYEGHLDTVVLIYMVGSNLESENGLATTDLHEIGDAIKNSGNPDAEVKIIVETGGSSQWKTDFDIDPQKLQRFEVGADELILKDEVESKNMANPSTLADFMAYGIKAYPADKYDLILWDHGGGSVMGFASDELYSGSMMRLNKLQKAFEAVDAHFEFIGFDACLMGTVETAYMLAPYADYLIASEEMEPGDGWFYTNWIDLLFNDPKTSAVELGKQIIDDFASTNDSSGDLYTLSIIDLNKISPVYDALMEFAGSSSDALQNKQYKTISRARSNARDFGNGNYEQVDIIDFATKSDVEGNEKLGQAVADSIVYFKTNMKNANGLAMYYPCSYLDEYDRMVGVFKALDFDDSYTDSLSGFCTVMAQSDDNTKNGEGYSKEKWYKADLAGLYRGETDLGLEEELGFTEINGETVIDITPEQFDDMTFCGMEVWSDNGVGYTLMGVDSDWSTSSDGDHIAVSYDGAQMTINGDPAPYFMEELGIMADDTAYQFGYIPAMLNDDTEIRIWVEILISANGEYSTNVCGYWVLDEMEYEGGDSVRNLKQFEKGDKIQFIYTFCDYDLGNVETIPTGKKYKAWKDLEVGYSLMVSDQVMVGFELEDVYKNKYYTDYLTIESDYLETEKEINGG